MDHKNKSDKNQHQEHHHHNEHSPDQHADHNKSKEHHKKHVNHSGHEQMFRKRFWWSLLLSIPVLIYSPLIQRFLNFTAPDFPGSIWIPFVFSLIIFGYGGIPFLKMAIPEIQNRKPGMMTLISLAISVAFVYSLFAQLTNLGEGFFWELVTLIDIMLLGHWLEMRSVRQASGALNELAKLIPDTADRIREDGSTETVSATDLRQDDLVLVRPGASIPADGVVTEGESQVNESMITGESKPVKKSPEEKVIAGTINGEGSLRVRVTATGDETALAGIMRLVEQAQQSKSPTQLLADKAAGWLFYIALAVAALTAVAWAIAIG
ncbi:MAG: HAD-IC family P-type ATPase, partial [Anaerolineaceae bacterium]|nr:HAD-IC family P-type ATPase [Anaerolineaceae bacterium]